MKKTVLKFASVLLVFAMIGCAVPAKSYAQYEIHKRGVEQSDDKEESVRETADRLAQTDRDNEMLNERIGVENEVSADRASHLSIGRNEIRIGYGFDAMVPSGLTHDIFEFEDVISDFHQKWNPISWNLSGSGVMYMPAKWYTFNLDYGYWIKDWCYVGLSVIWTGAFAEGVNRLNEFQRVTYNYNAFTALPNARFAWVRRNIVNLYSAVGLGYSYSIFELESGKRYNEGSLAYDVTLLGISVGRKIFGYFEGGFGARGMFRAGIGCRF